MQVAFSNEEKCFFLLPDKDVYVSKYSRVMHILYMPQQTMPWNASPSCGVMNV